METRCPAAELLPALAPRLAHERASRRGRQANGDEEPHASHVAWLRLVAQHTTPSEISSQAIQARLKSRIAIDCRVQ